MRRLKQLAALVLTGTLLLAMAGCSQTGSAQQPDTVTVAGSGEVLLMIGQQITTLPVTVTTGSEICVPGLVTLSPEAATASAGFSVCHACGSASKVTVHTRSA